MPLTRRRKDDLIVDSVKLVRNNCLSVFVAVHSHAAFHRTPEQICSDLTLKLVSVIFVRTNCTSVYVWMDDRAFVVTMGTDHSALFAFSVCTRLMSLLFLCLSLLASVYAQNRSDEVSAVQEFTSSESLDSAGLASTWDFSDENACSWAGVTCTTNFTVAELDLSGWGLSSGDFRTEPLSRLRDLSRLDLSSNYLTGLLDIGSLTGLTWLDLSQNYFLGLSPTISSCQRLRFLSLEQNELMGPIPSTLSDLKDLQFLLLAQNLLSGPLSGELTGLSNIVIIDLSYNYLNGSIPALPKLTKLISLKLDSNNFTKFEESWFSTVSQSLEVLSVSFNQLEEALPSNITLPKLQVFNMSGNRLPGGIPLFRTTGSQGSLYSYTRLFEFYGFSIGYGFKGFSLDLSQNQLRGKIPSNLLQTSNTSCISLNLSHNFLTGNIPFDGTNYYCLNILDVSYNNLSGPQLLLSRSSKSSTSNRAEILLLGNNQLSGDAVDILISAGQMGVSQLGLETNLLAGDLSRLISFSNDFFTSLVMVDLSNNYLQWTVSDNISDPITPTLERLSPQVFRVRGNNFSGTPLPATCFQNNSVSPDYGFVVLDFSDSHLKGSISSAVFNSICLQDIEFLSLSNNDITGSVPDSILVIPTLEVLDLSSNHLTGHLPVLPANSNLNNPSCFEGNDGLCGYPLSSCPPDLPGTGIQWWILLIIIGGCVITAVGSCLVATWGWRVYHKRHKQDADLIKMLLEKESTALMPLRDLKKATENFSKSAQIGEGGFGTVYIGKLNNGTMVAIKRSKREGSEKDKEQFLNEVRILSQVNHRNLVKLLGCCMENKITVLVFEYVPNGTLQEHLSGNFGEIYLSWNQRVHIAMQTADALSCLHSAAVFPIYHRDVKSANILLDENLNAKVADFGISKLAPLRATHVSTIAVQGTIGYIDPEYYTSYQLTDRSDVFSFGVVLLELVSAKPALDFQRVGDQASLVYFASSCIEKGNLLEFIDPTLEETYNDVDGNGRKSILALCRLAFKCLEMPSKDRPSMKEVWKELENLWGELEEMSKHLECSLKKDDSGDLQLDHRVLLYDHFSGDSSSCNVQTDGSSIQMAQNSCSASLE